MSVARVTELSALSPTSFEDAIQEGISRATSTLRGVRSAWIKDMNVEVQDGNVIGYRVSMAITFVLEGDTMPAEERPMAEERPITEEPPIAEEPPRI